MVQKPIIRSESSRRWGQEDMQAGTLALGVLSVRRQVCPSWNQERLGVVINSKLGGFTPDMIF